MGRKKPSSRDEESAPVGGGKSKKKAFVINDDEYSIGTDLLEEPLEEKVVAPIAKGKKGGLKREEDAEVDDEKVGVGEVDVDEDEPAMNFAGKKNPKGKKSGKNNSFSSSAFGLLGEDEDDGGDVDKNGDGEDNEEEGSQTVIAFAEKKKTSKNKKTSGKVLSAFDLLQEEEGSEEEDDVSDSNVSFSGKKKPSKSKKSGGNALSAFDLLQEEEQEEEEERKENAESPKEHEDEDVAVSFTGKKKKKKPSQTSGNLSSAALLGEENDDDASVSKDGAEDEEDDLSALNFSGKKKSSKKKNSSANAPSEIGNSPASSDFVESRQPPTESKIENPTIDNEESSKNKKKKKKGGKGAQEEEDLDKILAELGGAPSVSKPVAAPLSASDVPFNQSELQEAVGDKEDKDEEPLELVKNAAKNKKKKKKAEKTAQDEDDLNKILAEIDGAPPVIEPSPSSAETPSELAEVVGDKEADDEGLVESAAAKKKKKKKGKDKKAAVEEKQEETTAEVSSKMLDKKVPKHVREMQERLAKLKEAEEKKKREEEERLRKEEEERRRQEELERQAEEKKRLKKEKEKEKLLKKKQEGKLLTGRQKEEARRLEAMRNQILAAGGLQIPAGESTSKRPIYQKKKPKAPAQSNGSSVVDATPVDIIESSDSIETMQEFASEISKVEPENVQETAPANEKDLSDTIDVVEENGVAEEEDDDDEDWDAKSWDDADLKLPGKGFSDEEVDSEPEPLPKRELKVARPATSKEVEPPSKATKQAGNGKISSVVPHIPEKIKEHKTKDIEPEVASKNEDRAPVAQNDKNSNSQNGQNLRSPICCIMGHVDTGKTKLLDCIRGTNVQEGEAGGITQQIGATYFPAENIRERTKELKADAKLNVPGLLVIDTPGHESFTNLRSRGSGLCDIAILVVDIMHGLEPQTIESLNLLKMRNTEFIVALNKVDRLYSWKTCRNAPITKAMKQQSKDVQIEFNMRLTQIITQFKEQGLNTELYYKNKEMGETFSIVPTSAISGEGIPDLLLLLVQWAQKTMISRLTYSDEVQCTVLEVKVVEGHGTTIDVVLVNGVLHEGDQIIVCGLQGPIVTTIRALLTPHPMKELRVKGSFLHHKEIKAAQGIKITAQGLEHAIAGTSLYVVKAGDDLEEIKDTAMEDMKSVMNRIDKSGEGVYVQASTLGSLEALLEFLKSPAVRIPVSGISIGPVHKKDVMKASVMLEKKKEYGTILAFDVKVTQEARDLAEELGVKIFIADIIYHLFDQFKAYIDNLKEEKKKQASEEAVFPCVLKIIPNCVFNTKDPIVLGVDVLEGIAKVGTPICVPQKDFIDIGRIASIENNHKPVDYAKKGQKVAIKIIGSNPEEQQKMVGRHFEIEDELVSKISRSSLDALKEHYRDDLSVEEKRLLFKLKTLFKIP